MKKWMGRSMKKIWILHSNQQNIDHPMVVDCASGESGRMTLAAFVMALGVGNLEWVNNTRY